MAGQAPGGQTTPPNINSLAQGITGAGVGSAQGMAYTPLSVGAPTQAQLNPYMNPYTTSVIDAQQADVLRGANLGLDQLGAQAQHAKAFGGSRHGVAMSELGRGVGEIMGQQATGLRQANFAQAQQMAQQNQLANQQADITGAGHRLASAGQLGQMSNLGFGMGQQVTQNLSTQGAMQQALQQAVFDEAKSKYQSYVDHPAKGLAYLNAALGVTPTTPLR